MGEKEEVVLVGYFRSFMVDLSTEEKDVSPSYFVDPGWLKLSIVE